MSSLLQVSKLEKEDLKQMDMLNSYCFQGQGYSNEESSHYFPLDFYIGVFDYDEVKKESYDDEKVKQPPRRILASCMIMIPYLIKASQSPFQCIGIRSVTSKPEYRNRGLVRKMFEECFKIMKEKNIPLSNLYPFKMSYYEKYGYVMCEEAIITKFDPVNLMKLRHFPESKKLRIREVYGEKIHEDIKSVYRQVCQNKYDHCLLERSEWFWSELTMRNQVFQFVCYLEEENNESSIPVGYIIWHFENDKTHWYSRLCGIKEEEISSRRAFVIREMNWTYPDVKIELFRFIWKHRDQLKTCGMLLPEGEDISGYISDPLNDLKRFICPKTQMRIVLLKPVLEQVKVSKFYELNGVIIKVIDSMCIWNEGFWKLDKKLGQTTLKVEKIIQKEEEEEKEDVFCLEIKQLTMMIIGVRTIDDILGSVGTRNSVMLQNVRNVQKVVEGLRCFERRRFNYFNDLF